MTTTRGLGRIARWDDRNLDHLIRDVLPDAPPRKRTWRLDVRLDQGQEGSCVGHGWTHRVDAAPKLHRYDHAQAVIVYKRAQQLDDTPGENYEGTSVLAGAKACVELGWVTVYRWATTLDDIVRTVSHDGPVVMGTNWYQWMFDPADDGYLNVGGSVAGGHCWIIRGVDPAHERVLMTNSWGRGWGRGGDAFLRFTDLERLLSEDGEAVAPTER